MQLWIHILQEVRIFNEKFTEISLVSWLVILVALLPPIITGAVCFPLTLPGYVIVTNVGKMTNDKLVKKALMPPSRDKNIQRKPDSESELQLVVHST